MRNAFIMILFCLVALSCKSPEARRPEQQASGTFINKSVERNKKIFEAETAKIKKIMDANPDTPYFASDSGFWYFYNTKDTTATVMPDYGDKITFTFDIKKLDGTSIISEEENGVQAYRIDQSNQDLISGLRDGVKLMKVGERVTFLLPSYKAFGYYGIENKLGTNVPIQSTVTLKSIEQSLEN